MSAASGLSSAVQSEYTSLLGDLQSDSLDFAKLTETKNTELEKAENLLYGKTLLDPLSFTNMVPKLIWGEEPEDFYLRTVHSGNIGTTAYTAVSNYVDLALKLPKINDTFGDETYV